MNIALLRAIVGSNRLYTLRKSFPESFKKIAFFIFTLRMGSTSQNTTKLVILAQKFNVRGICLCWIKQLLVTFVCSNRLYVPRRSFPESFWKNAFFIFTFQMASTWPSGWPLKKPYGAVLRPSAKWKWKMQFFWNFQEMISWLCRVDERTQTSPELFYSKKIDPTNIEKMTKMTNLVVFCDVEAIRKVKMKNGIFLKLLGNDLLSV